MKRFSLLWSLVLAAPSSILAAAGDELSTEPKLASLEQPWAWSHIHHDDDHP
jgi:hypothetical protein